MRCIVLLALSLISSTALAREEGVAAAVEAAAVRWTKSLNAVDLDTMSALMTSDVMLLDPKLAPVSGADAVGKAIADAMAGGKGSFSTTTKDVRASGDTAWRVGALSYPLPNGVSTSTSTLEIWRRVDGAWKLHRMMSGAILTDPQILRPILKNPVTDSSQPAKCR